MGGMKMVDDKIGGKKVVVFSKSYCPYCTRAKKTLQKYNLSPAELDVLEIENMPECAEIQEYLRELTGASSVPRIFISGKAVGGSDDLAALDSSGKLEAMLK